MDKVFKGYLPLSSSHLKELFLEGLIVFDTSSLFNLYRYDKKTTEDIFNVLENMKERLWLPHMVGLEYHGQRCSILNKQESIYGNIKEKLSKFKTSISSEFSDRQHSLLSYETLETLICSFEEEFINYINSIEESHPNYIKNDPIRDKIVNLFRGKTGEPVADDDLSKSYSEAADRFSKKIPPGYKDEKNKENIAKLYGCREVKSKYADFLIWKEMILLAKDRKKPILFITDEKKEDWCWREHGMILGARPELVTEMEDEAGVHFHIVSTIAFLNQIKKYGKVKLSPASIEDVEKSNVPTWKEELVQTLEALGGTASLNQIYDYIKSNTKRELSSSWQATARRTIYYYCSDRDIFLGNENLFKALDDSTYALNVT